MKDLDLIVSVILLICACTLLGYGWSTMITM